MNKEIITAEIATSEYIAQFRDVNKFIEFCKVCNNYNRMWSCPPLDAPICCKAKDIEAFSVVTIIGIKINIDAEIRCKPSNIEERDILIRDILFEVRKEFDKKLLLLEQQIEPSLLYYAGSCRVCAPESCSRIDNKPCRFPDKMRSTLEAVGFDMGRTTSELLGIELKWCDNLILPPYFTLIYGFVSNDSIADQIKHIIIEFN
ncbi:MAG: DUF2284 domain-containing protein [Rikenellaceae bacterium]